MTYTARIYYCEVTNNIVVLAATRDPIIMNISTTPDREDMKDKFNIMKEQYSQELWNKLIELHCPSHMVWGLLRCPKLEIIFPKTEIEVKIIPIINGIMKDTIYKRVQFAPTLTISDQDILNYVKKQYTLCPPGHIYHFIINK